MQRKVGDGVRRALAMALLAAAAAAAGAQPLPPRPAQQPAQQPASDRSIPVAPPPPVPFLDAPVAPASLPANSVAPIPPPPPMPAAPPSAPTAASAAANVPASPPSPAPPVAASPALDAAFPACLARLRGEAAARGIARTTFDRFTEGLVPDASVLASLDFQPEFRTPIWDYLAGLVDDERIAEGRALLDRWRDTLAAVETRFGVDPATVVAVWGVESDYGKSFGRRPVLRSLATLSCAGRRQPFFRGELFAALRILGDGHVDAERLLGSWAGAFGHTQFMPSTFLRVAVDQDGDGRRDVIASVPDALGSTASFLKRAGWRTDEPWGWEVRLPAGFDASHAGRGKRRALSAWAAMGLRRVDGAPIEASDARAAVLLPAGPTGPAFLVLRNFDAIYSYNAAESYALAIAHLSDRLRGAGPLATPWPTDDPGLSRAERRELQSLLIERGYDIGAVDGMNGAASRRAIRDLQPSLGLEPDGRAGRKLLEALRR